MILNEVIAGDAGWMIEAILEEMARFPKKPCSMSSPQLILRFFSTGPITRRGYRAESWKAVTTMESSRSPGRRGPGLGLQDQSIRRITESKVFQLEIMGETKPKLLMRWQ